MSHDLAHIESARGLTLAGPGVRARAMIDGRRMQLLRKWPQVLLLLAGLASFALGDWLVAVQAGALLNEAQGMCDFISCVNSTTVPELIAGVVLILIGTATGITLIRDRRGDRYGGV